GRLTSSDIEVKWLSAWAMLTGHGDDSAIVVIYAPKPTADVLLPAFASELGDKIHRSLAEARRK
ncbi:MAG: exosortase-associated EpsI family protein, partial [Azonexus sp.]